MLGNAIQTLEPVLGLENPAVRDAHAPAGGGGGKDRPCECPPTSARSPHLPQSCPHNPNSGGWRNRECRRAWSSTRAAASLRPRRENATRAASNFPRARAEARHRVRAQAKARLLPKAFLGFAQRRASFPRRECHADRLPPTRERNAHQRCYSTDFRQVVGLGLRGSRQASASARASASASVSEADRALEPEKRSSKASASGIQTDAKPPNFVSSQQATWSHAAPSRSPQRASNLKPLKLHGNPTEEGKGHSD